MGRDRTKREQGGCNRLTRMITSFDQYGEPVTFKVKGADSFPSCLGTLFSIFSIVLIMAYASEKYIVLMNYGDTAYTSYKLELSNDDVENYQNIYNYEITSLHTAWSVSNKTTHDQIPHEIVS